MNRAVSGDGVLSMIGLARRALKAEPGAFLAQKSLQSGKSNLIIVAADAADNIKKKFTDSCKYYRVLCIEYSNKAMLGKYTGKENIAVVSINDINFAKGILGRFEINGV